MAVFVPFLLVLLLASGGQANTDELSTTSYRAVLGPSPQKSYEPPEGPPATTTTGQRSIKIGPCFPNNGTGNALTCLELCTSKGYAGGHCDVLPGGLCGDCYCITS